MQIKTRTEYKKTEKCQDTFCDSSAEYILPDYNTDVRKILYSNAKVRPSGKFVGDDEVEFSGIVVYDVVYADSENNISSVSFTSDYDASVRCSEEKYVDCYADTRIVNFSLRLVGPRKFSAKSSLVLQTKMLENDALPISGNAFEGEESPEVNTETLRVHTSLISGTVEREYAERIAELEGAIADEVKIIYTDVDAIVESIEIVDSSVVVGGTLRIISVIQNGEEPAYLIEKNVSIEETVPFEGLREDMKLTPELVVTSLRSTVNPTDDGVDVVVSVIVEFYVIGEINEDVEIVTDAYMKTVATNSAYSNFAYTELCGAQRTDENISTEVKRKDLDCEKMRECYILSSDVKIESISGDKGGAKIEGEVKYTGFATEVSDEGKISYLPIKFSTHFEKNVNLSCQNAENLRFEVKAKPHSVNASLDATTVYVSSAVSLSVLAFAERGVKALSSLEISPDSPYEASSSKVIVYYPTDGETLFSVAKKFHTTKEKLALDNSLTEMVSGLSGEDRGLRGVKKLLIM